MFSSTWIDFTCRCDQFTWYSHIAQAAITSHKFLLELDMIGHLHVHPASDVSSCGCHEERLCCYRPELVTVCHCVDAQLPGLKSLCIAISGTDLKCNHSNVTTHCATIAFVRITLVIYSMFWLLLFFDVQNLNIDRLPKSELKATRWIAPERH